MERNDSIIGRHHYSDNVYINSNVLHRVWCHFRVSRRDIYNTCPSHYLVNKNDHTVYTIWTAIL